jgi:hypothetical protein
MTPDTLSRIARHFSSKPFGRSPLTPPTRAYEMVSRAPVTSSTSSYSQSRAFIMYRNMVKAPISMVVAPMQVR